MKIEKSLFPALIRQLVAKKRDRLPEITQGDERLIQSFNADFHDLLKIASLIEENAPDDQIRLAIRNLDTIVRDYIPDAIYNYYFRIFSR